MTFYEQMVPLLSNLLEIGETLKAPIYGTLLQKKRNYTFGYLGLRKMRYWYPFFKAIRKN